MTNTRPTMTPFRQLINLLIFAGHQVSPALIRRLYRMHSKDLTIFGGRGYGDFYGVRELMAEEGEKIDWFSGPLQDRADYLTKSYVPFLLEGPNHELRRAHIIRRVAEVQNQLGDLEAILGRDKDIERSLVRFLYRHFARIELTEKEITDHLQFRERARVLTLLPKLMRTTVLRRWHDEVRAFRTRMLGRIEDAGETIADSWFDVIWFNAGTLGFYPVKALETLRTRVDLQPVIRAEAQLPPGQRPKTRALINEMLRIHTRIASTNYLRNGRVVEIALIVTAGVDPLRYASPNEVILERDHSDSVAFSGAAKTRGCPAETLAPDLMACIVAQQIRAGALANVGSSKPVNKTPTVEPRSVDLSTMNGSSARAN